MNKQQRVFSFNWHHIAALTIALFSFFMSGLVSERVFEHLPHLEDEVAYLYQARIFAGGQIVITSPQPSNAFWQPFVVDSSASGMRFGKYTPGWPALLALGLIIGQAWLINALLSALTVVVVYRLGCEIFNPDVGLIAALLTAFSPAALLLNGTLMSHTAGLFYTTLFFYCYWRMEKAQHPHWWALAAGLTLGVLAATRPLTTLAIALPFIVWSAVRIGLAYTAKDDLHSPLSRVWKTLQPLLALSFCTLLIASSIPLFNYAATGDPAQNLYELVWNYDRVGFGEGYGRNTHRLSKAVNHARFDLSLTAADLFGWQFEPITTEDVNHFQNESDFYPARGYSFILLPFGVLVGLFAYNQRQRRLRAIWFAIWALIALLWVLLPLYLERDFLGLGSFSALAGLSPQLDDDPLFSWFWIIASLLWLYLPLVVLVRWKKTPQLPYTWLLLSVVFGIVIVQMLYWIGSQRYSTRYYFEALSAAAIISALPLAWIIERLPSLGADKSRSFKSLGLFRKGAVYAVLIALCVFTLYFYSTARIMALYRYNQISPQQIEAIQARRVDDRPILVIMAGDSSGDNRVRWRAYGALMAVTSPYLNSDIVVVRDFGGNRDAFIARFPERQVIDMYAIGNDAYFSDEMPED